MAQPGERLSGNQVAGWIPRLLPGCCLALLTLLSVYDCVYYTSWILNVGKCEAENVKQFEQKRYINAIHILFHLNEWHIPFTVGLTYKKTWVQYHTSHRLNSLKTPINIDCIVHYEYDFSLDYSGLFKTYTHPNASSNRNIKAIHSPKHFPESRTDLCHPKIPIHL